jgi:hypothetical protein
MSQKKETIILISTLLITLGLVGGLFWLFTVGNLGQVITSNSPNENSATASNQSTSERISFGKKV